MIKGKSVIVTGSTSGIGQAIATAFASAGCHVMLNGFGDPAGIESFRAGLEKDHGVQVLYSAADMSRADEIEAMVKDAETAFGRVDILVNNAGIQYVAPVDEFPTEKWDAIISINLSSAFHTIHSVLPGMKKRGWGRIINIASAHGLVASPFKSAYVAAKHGVIGLTKVVALEVAEQGITCNAICPGYVKTPLVEGQINDQAKVHDMSHDEVIRNIILAAQPTKKFVTFEELNALALFLADEHAASINGAAISIDGGWTAK
ncbi:MAG: 3-hydroxybutyrate dehydrogenase [Desulfobacteraceae bacterium]|nr:MAG: 3-hydroxybutyrate dehydrogenase [Desulfobacteraceae bacterium]